MTEADLFDILGQMGIKQEIAEKLAYIPLRVEILFDGAHQRLNRVVGDAKNDFRRRVELIIKPSVIGVVRGIEVFRDPSKARRDIQ